MPQTSHDHDDDLRQKLFKASFTENEVLLIERLIKPYAARLSSEARKAGQLEALKEVMRHAETNTNTVVTSKVQWLINNTKESIAALSKPSGSEEGSK